MSFKTRIYIADCDCLEDGALFGAFFSAVSDERRQKTEKFRFESDKRLSLGAELLLMNAFKDFCIDYKSAELVFGENEKPYLKNNEIFFNLSHSGKYAVCAVCENEVGVDIEQIENAEFKIAEKVFTESELKRINYSDDENLRKEEFIRLWTLKESYMKYCGRGLSILPREIEFEFCGGKPCYKNLYFKEQRAGDYLISCCTKADNFEDGLTFVDFSDINFQQKILNI